VYRLVTRETIEEKIVEMHAGKRRLARSILDEGGAVVAADDAELRALLEDDADGSASDPPSSRSVTSS
jgi:SNF2 family DNA or RNA helicase